MRPLDCPHCSEKPSVWPSRPVYSRGTISFPLLAALCVFTPGLIFLQVFQGCCTRHVEQGGGRAWLIFREDRCPVRPCSYPQTTHGPFALFCTIWGGVLQGHTFPRHFELPSGSASLAVSGPLGPDWQGSKVPKGSPCVVKMMVSAEQ